MPAEPAEPAVAGRPATEDDASFDRYARMVRRLIGVPVALVTIVESERQVFPGAYGLPEPYQSTRETPLSHSFCQYVVADRRPLIVDDARLDARLRDNLAIDDLGVVAYAGWPLTDHAGRVIGSLCAIDDRPRRWTDDDLETLADLAAACSAELALREQSRVADEAFAESEHLRERSRVLLALSESLAATTTRGDVADVVSRVGLDVLGCTRSGVWLRPDLDKMTSDPLGLRVEKLELVPADEVVWEEASPFAVLSTEEDNPVGRVFTTRELALFGSRAEQDAAFGDTHRSTSSGEARALAPLRMGPQLLGVLVLVWPETERLGDAERTTIAAMATYVAQALARASLLEQQVQVSSTLQQAMLTRLPDAGSITLAARYRPAESREQVGGDWYDAIALPSGGTAVMIGDVVGHDIEAAALMGQLKTTLRALTWVGDDAPSAGVRRLDRSLPDLGISALATTLLAQVTPVGDPTRPVRYDVQWSSAGHPPPLLVSPDGDVTFLDGDPDLMLGVEPGHDRHDHTVTLPPGAMLLLFTDGLVERRGASLDDGLADLLATATRHRGLDAEDFLDAVLADLLGVRLSDDVAVLAVRLG